MFYHTEGMGLHLDGNCGATYVIQITGQKRWKLQPPESDGGMEDWSFAPEYEGILSPGETLVFHMGWLHETSMVKKSDEGDRQEPPLSLNMIVPSPLPIYFLREYMETLKKQRSKGECPTRHCEAGWEMTMKYGFALTGLNKVRRELEYRIVDWLHGL